MAPSGPGAQALGMTEHFLAEGRVCDFYRAWVGIERSSSFYANGPVFHSAHGYGIFCAAGTASKDCVFFLSMTRSNVLQLIGFRKIAVNEIVLATVYIHRKTTAPGLGINHPSGLFFAAAFHVR
jgi:hypothetical protein